MKLVLAIVLVLAAPVAADSDDPRILFASGRYAAAGEMFQRRWETRGDPTDGVNAVVSWRTAGRYARARTLLARLRASDKPPTGEAATTATELDQRLERLTSTAKIVGALDNDALITVDDDVAERVGGVIVLDVGEHDVTITQADCEPYVWHGTAYPGGQQEIMFEPVCHRTGTLHVRLDVARGAFTVDGATSRAVDHEANVSVEPGTHQLAVVERERLVYREPVTVRAKQAADVRVRYPWRAFRATAIFGITTLVLGGNVASGTALGFTIGVWGSRFRFQADAGSLISNAGRLAPPVWYLPGRPWGGGQIAYHLRTRALWNGRVAGYRFALDFDPIACRSDEVRETSYFGIRANPGEARINAWSFLPLALSGDGPFGHIEITLWPISAVRYMQGDFVGDGYAIERNWGVGAFLTVLGGWRIY